MQNWVANTILKRRTGVADASIVAMAVPSRLPPFVDDEFGQFLTGTLSFFMIIMFVPVRPPCPACLRVHCLQTKMQIHDRVSGFSRKIEQIIDLAPLVTNPVEKFIFPAKRFHLARRGATCLFKDCRQGKMKQVS